MELSVTNLYLVIMELLKLPSGLAIRISELDIINSIKCIVHLIVIAIYTTLCSAERLPPTYLCFVLWNILEEFVNVSA